MADLIHLDYQLLAIVQRLEIPLGFREKTIKEICEEQEIDLNFFLQLTNAFHDKEYFPQDDFLVFPVEWLIKYLKNAHKCYITYKIPEIDKQILDLEKESTIEQPNVKLIIDFFKEYIREFSAHIELEEKSVFSYVMNLDKTLQDESYIAHFKKQFSNYKIDKYVADHNNIEEKLFDLKNILLKYLPPPTINCKYHALLYEIFRLESDLQDHSNLEEKVLIPKVRAMEKEMERLSKENS